MRLRVLHGFRGEDGHLVGIDLNRAKRPKKTIGLTLKTRALRLSAYLAHLLCRFFPLRSHLSMSAGFQETFSLSSSSFRQSLGSNLGRQSS